MEYFRGDILLDAADMQLLGASEDMDGGFVPKHRVMDTSAEVAKRKRILGDDFVELLDEGAVTLGCVVKMRERLETAARLHREIQEVVATQGGDVAGEAAAFLAYHAGEDETV